MPLAVDNTLLGDAPSPQTRHSGARHRGREAALWREPGIHPATSRVAKWIPGSTLGAALCAAPSHRSGMTIRRKGHRVHDLAFSPIISDGSGEIRERLIPLSADAEE
jgi:hypothetical protein